MNSLTNNKNLVKNKFLNFQWYFMIVFQILMSRRNNKIYLLGSVEHMNYGDHAINLAEENFLSRKYGRFINIPENLINKSIIFMKLFLKKGDVFFFHGGGNMGDVWPYQEKLRHDIYNAFPKNKIIIFPQSCNFKENSELLDKTKKLLANCKEVKILLRDKEAYEFAKNNFPVNVSIYLVPDIALTLSPSQGYSIMKKKRLITFFLRRDVEKLQNKLLMDLRVELEKKYIVRISDTVGDDSEFVFPNKREKFLKKKLVEFFQSELIVSDRLHAMIFAQITSTPAVIFDNNNHKIRNLYRTWLSKKNNILLVDKNVGLNDVLMFIENTKKIPNIKHISMNYEKVITNAIG